ncbi:hypothetical protein EV183_003297 [Coemansia sp. RSA 2336]|nr:hypothetical protein EV183_003297 [Coemansia sp. RSA 2336]
MSHQFVASTACVFFHRFYMRQSLEKYHHYQIAGACVLLASKVEENKRSLQDITWACANVASKGRTSEAEKSYKAWERLLKQQEIALLENICFDVEIEHPYKSIDALGAEFGIPVYISKAATAHVNDCLRSTICLRYRPPVIAAAALYLAIGIHKYTGEVNLFDSRIVKFPSNAEHETESCAMDMLGFYQREAEAEKQAKPQQQHQRPFT